MRSSFFVTASVLTSMFIAMAVISAVLTHAAHVQEGSLMPLRTIQN